MKTILTIQSQVAGARVGNSVAAFAFERLGVKAICLPTTLLGRRPDRAAIAGGDPGGGAIPAPALAAMVEALDADGALKHVDVVLSGYLGEHEQAPVILDAVSRAKRANPQAIYVCDPVMGDFESSRYVSKEIADAITRTLLPSADMITPNAWELGQLTEMPVGDITQTLRAARVLGRPALVTSAPAPTGGVGALFATLRSAWLVETPRAPVNAKGAGDLFTALFIAHRLNGRSSAVALEAAAGATYDVILRTNANGSDDLAIVESQDKLIDPDTWPTAQPLADQQGHE
jgi:pyridoxine kinase